MVLEEHHTNSSVSTLAEFFSRKSQYREINAALIEFGCILIDKLYIQPSLRPFPFLSIRESRFPSFACGT